MDCDRGHLARSLAGLSLCLHQVVLQMSAPTLGIGPCQQRLGLT